MRLLFRIVWFILTTAGFMLIGYRLDREQFILLISIYGLIFWGYIQITKPMWRPPKEIAHVEHVSIELDRFLFLAAVLFRVLLLVEVPNLSDDYVRFIWDGRLLAHGLNPYLYLPNQLVHTSLAATAGLTESLYKGLNSPNYFTVYPPVNQALFGIAAWFFPTNLLGTIVFLRIPILLAELGTLKLLVTLLRKFGKNPNLALLYGLNPLVILELTGNIHYEAVMTFFSLLAIVWLLQGRWLCAAVALAMGIGTKLLPLIFFPLLLRYWGWKRGLIYLSLTGTFTVLLFLPFVSSALPGNLFSSLNLYFQRFEFNASLYFVIRAIGYWITGSNIIYGAGIFLFIAIAVSIGFIAFRVSTRGLIHPLPIKMLLTLTTYWFLSTTVHPWYITSLVALTLFTPFRFPLLWSGLLILTYATYRTRPFSENLWLTSLEYGLVLCFGLIEWDKLKNQKSRFQLQ